MHRFLHRLGRRIQIIISIQKQKGDAKHLLFVFVAAGGNAEPLQEASNIENKAAPELLAAPRWRGAFHVLLPAKKDEAVASSFFI